MKPNQDKIEDQLLDALLHEQNRDDREQAVAEIENALNGQKSEVRIPVRPLWHKRWGIVAASVAIGGFAAVIINSSKEDAPRLASRDDSMTPEQERTMLAAIRAQEDKVEESHKVLTTISRTKGLRYRDEGEGFSDQDELYPYAFIQGSYTYQEAQQDASTRGGGLLLWQSGSDKVAGADLIDDAFSINPSPAKRRAIPVDESQNTERYGSLIDPVWQRPTENPLSTFSIDVDTASYANIRRMTRQGREIPADAVRIEECINAFKYQYEPPADGKAFAVHTELATCPWNKDNLLVKFGIKGREIAKEKRPVSNLVFLIDVSGSMQSPNKLPLVKESLKLLLHQLDERDSVSYVVYAGSEGVVLAPTKMTESGRVEALQALEKLESGGSTNGGAGITRAYQLALENFIEGGVNRVILASDGDFNVGITGQEALVSLVKERAAKNIYLSALAFGTGNLNDSMFEAISNDGNGNYFYIDDIREARKVFLENLTGSLITIAKDVKIQVEFNPGKVGSYRLIGYANRVLKDEDFNNDKVDAGDIGAGHTVTAFYEIVPAGMPQPNGGGVDPLKYQKNTPEAKAPAADPGDEWLTLKLRHKHPEGDISALQETVVTGTATPWQESGSDFQFATAVAMFGMKLRGMTDVSEIPWDGVRQLARSGLKDDKSEDRAEFVELIGEFEKRSR